MSHAGMTRRQFAQLGATASAIAKAPNTRKKIAAITSAYFLRSHSDDIVTRELEGYWIGDRFYDPPVAIASLYQDQIHPADVGKKLAMAYGVPIRKSISDALTLGSGKLAVDGVIVVAEHGDYPFNDKQQQLYPRFEFYSQVVDVFRASGRAVPVYCDKHLSYDWTKAKRMYNWSRELKFLLMAGSSVSVSFRRPELDVPRGADMHEALSVGSGWVTDGGIFHNLEVLQCFAERRRGGETGVRAVQHLQGDAVWEAAGRGLWSKDLMTAALARAERPGKIKPEDAKNPVLCVIEYNDGFRGAALMLPGVVNEYLFALRMKGEKQARGTLLYLPPENSNNFSVLVNAMNQMFTTGRPPYPVERTLLTTGALSFLMESAYRNHARIETPMLRIVYQAPENSYYAHGAGS
ncbi:MAG: hypothetical protein M3Z85_17265 [Acidobacteriota bacterium]|nr:hypothetical protein [Acidobacteriota bacterium]